MTKYYLVTDFTACHAFALTNDLLCLVFSLERRLVVPSQRGLKSLSRTFSLTTPGWWKDLPLSGMVDPCQPSSNNWKLFPFDTTWLPPPPPPPPPKKKKKLNLYFYLLIPFLASLYLFEQCLRLGITSTHFLSLFASLRWITSCIPQL